MSFSRQRSRQRWTEWCRSITPYSARRRGRGRPYNNKDVRTHLQYGQEGLEVDIPAENVTVVTPRYVEGLPDEAAAFREAVRSPTGARPLREGVRAHHRVAVVIPDITRPLPTERLLPRLFAGPTPGPKQRPPGVNGAGADAAHPPPHPAPICGRDAGARP